MRQLQTILITISCRLEVASCGRDNTSQNKALLAALLVSFRILKSFDVTHQPSSHQRHNTVTTPLFFKSSDVLPSKSNSYLMLLFKCIQKWLSQNTWLLNSGACLRQVDFMQRQRLETSHCPRVPKFIITGVHHHVRSPEHFLELFCLLI